MMRKKTLHGLPYFMVSLCLVLHTGCSSVSIREILDSSEDPGGAPSPLTVATSSAAHTTSMPSAPRARQQNITLVFVAGVSICLAIFVVSYCIAYRTIMIRQEEFNRLYTSTLRGDQITPPAAGEAEGLNNNDLLGASLMSGLRTMHYRSSMLKEDTKAEENVMWVKDCAVCLSEYEEGEEMKVLPVCGHCFHETCISTWLKSQTTCPICRLSVRKGALSAADPAMGDLAHERSMTPGGLHVAVDISSNS